MFQQLFKILKEYPRFLFTVLGRTLAMQGATFYILLIFNFSTVGRRHIIPVTEMFQIK